MLVACGGSGDTTIDITHDPCSNVTLGSSANASQMAGIDGAIGLWGGRGIPLARVAELPAIEIVFERASEAFRGLYDDETGVIHINDGLTELAPLSIVIAHELGHAFGLPHITGRASVMNSGNLVTPPNEEDLAALEALWGQCEPLQLE